MASNVMPVRGISGQVAVVAATESPDYTRSSALGRIEDKLNPQNRRQNTAPSY